MENTGLIVAQNSVTAVLEHQKALWNGVQNIDSSIVKNEKELKQKLESLEKAQANIEVTRHWYGPVDIDSVCNSLVNVYDDLRKYIQTCGSAIRTTNENLSHTLGLIRILAMIEKDLYEQVDNETIQSNVLKDLIRDWCKKNNIREEEVNSLLESSFQRAYTLRDRINNIRSEIFKKFEYYDSEILELESNIESLKSFVSSEKTKTLKELSNLYSSKQSELINLSSKKINELLRLHEKNLKTINKYSKGIEDKYNEFIKDLYNKKEDVVQLSEEFKEYLNKNINVLNEKQNEAIKEISSESQKKIDQFNFLCESILEKQKSYKEDIENNHKQIISENEGAHSKIKEKIDLFEEKLKLQLEAQKKEYDAMLISQKTLFSETLEKAHTQAKQLVFYGTIAGVLMASALFYAITVMF